MKKIDGEALSLNAILKDNKFSIDYYQRDYKWEQKQLQELIDDLTSKFLEAYDPAHTREQVAHYPFYFLGSIVISDRGAQKFIIDGQQRLTTLTLLLTYLRRLQGDAREPNIDDLIVSMKYGKKSFNLDVEDRISCMTALFEGKPFSPSDDDSESVQNLHARFEDIAELLPDEVQDNALPYFIDWLLECVQIVQITAFSDDDAYTIFETMNDRGLQLRPIDMLKGYLLASVDASSRKTPTTLWTTRVQELAAIGKDTDTDFFKSWLRSQYADSIRERRKDAEPLDYDRIGTEFHRWLRANTDRIGLARSDDFEQFIMRDFEFYSRTYRTIMSSIKSDSLVPGYEHVRYNADHRFTLQVPMLLAPLVPTDSDAVVSRKIEIVSRFADILLARRIWNHKAIDHSTLQYRVFVATKNIRGLDIAELSQELFKQLDELDERFDSMDRLRLNQQNRKPLHRVLARLTDYLEVESGNGPTYLEMTGGARVKYEIEHIWANHAERHTDEFAHPSDFADHRNLVGDLLLLNKKFNASFGDKTYEEKLPHYYAQNLLARSLNSKCYENNPGFVAFVKRTGLPFKPYESFNAEAVIERGELYRQLAGVVWNPDHLIALGHKAL